MEIYKKYIVVKGEDAIETMEKLYTLGFNWKSNNMKNDLILRRALPHNETIAFILDFNVIQFEYDSVSKKFTDWNREELEDEGYEETKLSYLLREQKLERIIYEKDKSCKL